MAAAAGGGGGDGGDCLTCRELRAALAFSMTSDAGAVVESRGLVRFVGCTSRSQIPWALVGAPIESMITAAGDAWSEFELVEGTGWGFVFVAPEGLDRAANAFSAETGTVACELSGGTVWVNCTMMRLRPPDWGDLMAPGERVRLRFVEATRMVSIVWRGRAYDMAALPTTTNITHMRFGVALWVDQSMRITGASAGACSCACASVQLLCYSRGAFHAKRAQRSALPRAARAMRRSHSCDVPGGTCSRGCHAQRSRGVAVRARAALGRRSRLRPPARLLVCYRARFV
jgi:hypothetical protein